MPKISVIMPVYNGEKYLREAIDSILNQTYRDFELIILDDGSKDSTPDIVRSYADPRIRFYENEQNLGIAQTLNRGLALATGEYLARMDSDDIALPERLQMQVDYMDAHTEVAVCATGIRLFGSQSGERIFSTDAEQLKVDLLFACCFAHPTVMLRASVFRAEGFLYDEAYNKMEDYALWVTVSRKYALASLPQILLQYRTHPSQVTQNYTETYHTQNRSLKKRLLEELDLGTEENALLFTARDRKALHDENRLPYLKLLRQIEIANRKNGIYAHKQLTASLHSVMREVLASVPLSTACTYAKQCGLFRPSYALHRMARGAKAKALGKLRCRFARRSLRHKDFSIVSNNCWGGFIYQKYGLQYRTPTVGLYFSAQDYVKFCGNLFHYLSLPLRFIPWENASLYSTLRDSQPFPVGMLEDIEIYFMHYHSEAEAAEKWERRKKRINPRKLIFKMSQRELCTQTDVEAFLALPFANKVCFSYDAVPGAICVPALKGLTGDEQPIVTPYFDDLQYINHMQVEAEKKGK